MIFTPGGTSLPSRERGLKYAPDVPGVAGKPSLPSRERGLKLHMLDDFHAGRHVAPFVGAWIEIAGGLAGPEPPPRRSLRGSVD